MVGSVGLAHQQTGDIRTIDGFDSEPLGGSAEGETPREILWIPAGTFLMGPEDFYPEERPAHEVAVDGFWIDEHQVTVGRTSSRTDTSARHP